MTSASIRTATAADAPSILEIYIPYIEKTTITFEYEIPTLEEFTQRIVTTLQRYPYLVAEVNGKILGYAYAGVYKGRTAYDWSVETTVYVKENCPVKGIGSQLYQVLEEVLQQQNIRHLLACITAGNERSVKFHQKFGYEEIGTFPNIGFKFNEWCDVLWMQKSFEPLPERPEPFIPFSEINMQ